MTKEALDQAKSIIRLLLQESMHYDGCPGTLADCDCFMGGVQREAIDWLDKNDKANTWDTFDVNSPSIIADLFYERFNKQRKNGAI